ncbi:MAG: asparagine synthetase B, partial [Nanoarchaeota archaeon]|nr:asparagine synthetase B [Nanoarchaeota archaeon]MBU1855136.1 asparagine synthetase B [Nanoarchaeota archaeon]
MCGIVGFNWNDKNILLRMLKIIKHRGPDQQGTYFDDNISLGNVRLSIIDTSIKGKQPISNEDGSIVIVFNGEIYNYIELRVKLENKGHKFKSNTDTEVIIHSYEEFGEDCVSYFNGCFAFAIWDSNSKKLFLARDRMGIKPLYYYYKNSQFIFTSEIKTILELKTIKRVLNYQGLSQVLSFRCNNLEETLFKEIKKVMSGTVLIYQNNKIIK